MKLKVKLGRPFPNGVMIPGLKVKGWQESDIMDIREAVVGEIKKQNEDGEEYEEEYNE